MYYYEVIPATNKYHGTDGLTYSWSTGLSLGQVVRIKIRNLHTEGFVSQKVPKPAFPVHSIDTVFKDIILPKSTIELFYWLQQYYPAPAGVVASHFLPSNLSIASKPAKNEVKTPISSKNLPPLISEQTSVLNELTAQADGSFLLHGDTGSGKTRLYIELAKRSIDKNKSVLILTPEISLTPQLVDTFAAVFGDQVYFTHSALSPVQRKRLWLHILNLEKPVVLIGPRSALFMPINNLGFIAVDEFHDQAYKQESTPYYQAIRVSSKIAQIHGAKIVFGSATPSVNEYFLASSKQIPILRMTEKPAHTKGQLQPVNIQVVDLADSQHKTKYPLISTLLVKELRSCMERGEQAMIFLNKRGSARSVICQSCGWQAHCPRCDLTLVYHADTHLLYCHTCGFHQQTPSSCPSCNSSEIIFKSPGTKAIVTYLQSLFPEARIARFDKDNKKSERIEARHSDVKDGSIDILVGTQLLTKGHDLPNLSLVGILLAETGLNFPDYTAEERSYQIIRQILGRVGRGHRPGIAILQTFDPNNPTIQAAINGSWDDFYAAQLAQRQAYGFPPYFHVMKVRLMRSTRNSAKAAAQKLSSDIAQAHGKVEIAGPSPSFMEKHGTKWQWQFIIKSKNRSSLVEIAKTLPANVIADIDPSHLL